MYNDCIRKFHKNFYKIFFQKYLALIPKRSIIKKSLEYADMAELADAHGSGPCEGYFMGVRIPLSAPIKKLETKVSSFFIARVITS